MFSVGDRAIYAATYYVHTKKRKNQIGTIVRVGPIRLNTKEQVFDIKFDSDGAVRSMYLGNLIPANETPDWEI
jgi:hypothetical protein